MSLPVATAAGSECGLLGYACAPSSFGYSLGVDYAFYPADAVTAPYLSDSATVDQNVQQMREAVKEDQLSAIEAWLIRVNGGLFNESRTGATSQSWDYSVDQRLAGTYDRHNLIDPGTYNYAATGRVILDQMLRDLGFDDPELRDALSYPVLLAGAGARQAFGDITGVTALWGGEGENKHVRNLAVQFLTQGIGGAALYQIQERTLYGEDRADVRSLEIGFAHSQLLDIQRLAGDLGVPLDLSAFGYQHAAPDPYRLLDESAVLAGPN